MRWLVLIPLALLFGTFANDIDVAVNRSNQKRTMAVMRDAAQRFESGTPFAAMLDGWGRPIRVHLEGTHYSMISAGADGIFEMRKPEGPVSGLERDLVYADGNFLQMPEGI